VQALEDRHDKLRADMDGYPRKDEVRARSPTLGDEVTDTATPADAPVVALDAPRFFLDHGIIHDHATGKHLRTSMGDGPVFDAEVHDTLTMLNALVAARERICLVCGLPYGSACNAKPACTFDPSPQELYEDNKRLQAQLQAAEPLHYAICQAVSTMNMSTDIARSEDGRKARDVLREALVAYADAMQESKR
jgi:hypothetical protein